MKDLADKMIDYAKTKKVPGVVVLSDVGIDENGFAIGMPRDFENWIIGFNLKIVDKSGEVFAADEWDERLGIFVPVKRHAHVRARFTNMSGETNTDVYGGMTARFLQQALDKINGVRIASLCSSYHRQKAIKEMKLVKRKQRRFIDPVV